MVLKNELNTLSKRPDDVDASIGRPIIHYKHLRWGVGLGKSTVNSIRDPRCRIVAGYNDTDER
jgi:hypothetical protein